MKKTIYILIIFLAGLGYSSNLDTPDSPKSLSMGEISYVNDELSIFSNPALRSTITSTKINFNMLIYRDTLYTLADIGINLEKDANISLGAAMMKDTIYGISYGKKFDFGSLGANLKIFQNKSENNSSGFNGDLGFMTELKPGQIFIPDKLLFSVNNLGSQSNMTQNNLTDFNAKIGLYFSQVKAGIDFRISGNKPFQVNLGYETDMDLLSLRLGISYGSMFIFSGGVALILGKDQVAYSVTSLEDKTLIHQLSLNVALTSSKTVQTKEEVKAELDLKESIKAYKNQAMELFKNGNLKEAIDLWNKVLKLDKTDDVTEKYVQEATLALKVQKEEHFKAAENCIKSNKWNNAISELESVLNLEINNKKASDSILNLKTQLIEAYNAGNVYFEDKQYIKSIEKLQWILERYPKYQDCEAFIEKIQNELKKGQNEQGLIDKYYAEAGEEYKKSNLQGCVEKINKILSMDPKNEKALAFLGSIVDENFKAGLKYYGQNQFENAIAEWKKVLSIDPSNEKARFYVNEAEQQLQDKITKYFKAGIDNYNAGEYLKAIENWNIALASDPLHKEMNEYLVKALVSQGILFYRQEKLKEAVDYWEKAAKLNPNEEKITLYIKRAKNKSKMLEELEKK